MNMQITKVPKNLFLLSFFAMLTFAVSAAVNPVMIIKCIQDPLLRGELDSRSVAGEPPPFVPCDNSNECPDGMMAIFPDGCECVPICPDADDFDPPCTSCPGEITEWGFGVSDACGCTSTSEVCGCPDYLVFDDMDLRCEIPDVPCYDGNIMFDITPVDCDNPTGGLVEMLINIFLPADACVTIQQLIDCELSTDNDFVIALAGEFGSDAAFCDDDSDGVIELSILKLPEVTAIVALDVQQIPIGPCSSFGPVPTMGQWGIIILGLLMAIVGVIVVVKRKAILTFFF